MEKCSSPSSSSSVNGLKFGKKIYFEDMGSGVQPKAAPPSPAKKGRTGMVEPPRCQVEGCNVDLSDAKAYYSRHKVCGMHSKFPKVIVGGIEQRFCQQCSRFHQLPEFDQDKRSCRRRLAGHNERRRKPPPGSYLPSLRNDNHSKTGGLFMDFRPYPTPSWTNAASGQILENQKPQLTWLSHSQNPASDLVQASSTHLSYSSPGIHSDECFNGVSDASSALSLLSNQPWSSKPRSSGYEPISNLALVGPSMNPGIAIGGQFSCPSWDSPDMPPDLGLGQTSHPASNQYAGELGLAQPGDGQFHQVNQSRGFDTSTQHRHWSL